MTVVRGGDYDSTHAIGPSTRDIFRVATVARISIPPRVFTTVLGLRLALAWDYYDPDQEVLLWRELAGVFASKAGLDPAVIERALTGRVELPPDRPPPPV